MPTKMMQPGHRLTNYERAVTMAVGIVIERIRFLSKEDRDDLFDLVKELSTVKSEEDLECITDAMGEILEKKPISVMAVAHDSSTDGMENWLSFVSKRIKEARIAAGMTQDELAEKTGLPQSHICRLERGAHSPSHKTLERLANALGVPLSQLDPS